MFLQELPNAEIEFIPAEMITGILDRENPHFWNHHGYVKDDYIELAKQSKEIYEMWFNGSSVAEIQNNEDFRRLSEIYLSDRLCIKLYRCPNGKYCFVSDGRHRIAAAQLLNIPIPAKIIGEYRIAETKEG